MMFGTGDKCRGKHSDKAPKKTRDLQYQLKRSMIVVVGILVVDGGFETIQKEKSLCVILEPNETQYPVDILLFEIELDPLKMGPI